MTNFNIFDKSGVRVPITQKDLSNLYSNENFHTLMNWVEKSLRMTKKIISPGFFHKSFSKRDRDVIVSIIYTIYDVVTDIEPLGENGLIITSKDYLTMTELPLDKIS